MTDVNSQVSAGAEEIYDDYVQRRDGGEAVDFEALCAEHERHAAELRSLRADEEFVAALLPGALAPVELAPGGLRAAESSPGSLMAKLRAAGTRGERYRVLREVGRGGMGVVLEIWDDELRRNLAMKVVRELRDGETQAFAERDRRLLGRFLEEAQVTGQLDHPGIVPVHELGLQADGRPYFTMRLVDGDDLGAVFQRVRQGEAGWSQVRALHVLLRVCEAMSYAHGKRVIHRDLKPSNVMVGSYGEVYVMDWGLARVLGHEERRKVTVRPESIPGVSTLRSEERVQAPESSLLTMDGEIVGTPSFMSPEQARGEFDRTGPPSDVYAIGAMLYQLLGGEMPYVRSGSRRTVRELLEAVAAGPPRPLQDFAPDATPELVAICEKAMERGPEARYPTMQAFADDLRAYLEGRVVGAYETGAWAETRKWMRRNKALAASLAGGIAAVAVAGSIAGSHLQIRRELAVSKEVRVIAAELQDLTAFANNRDDARGLGPPLAEAWLVKARSLLEGSIVGPNPGDGRPRRVMRMRELLAEAEREASTEFRTPREGPADELAVKQAELLWIARILGREAWPPEPGLSEVLDAARLPHDATEKQMNERAWFYVDPRNPQFGSEQHGLVLARAASARAVDGYVWGCKDTLAWALLRCGQVEESRRTRDDVLRHAAEKVWASERDMPRWEDVVADLGGDTASRLHDDLAAEVERLEASAGAAQGRVFSYLRDQLWYEQVQDTVDGLELLAARTDLAERAARSTLARGWDEAIDAVQREQHYGGLRITPQLDLVPLGPDPDSGLWEFAHLPSGELPVRGRDARLELRRETGLVFVLLPGGRVPDIPGLPEALAGFELEPFLLSKYEMTQGQWLRLGGEFGTPYQPQPGAALQPVRAVTLVECADVLERTGGWLRVPTVAQWEYARSGGRTTPSWCGERPTPDAEILDFDESSKPVKFVRRIDWQPADGPRRAHPYGLHDTEGNVSEWCEDTYEPQGNATPQPGDGLRELRPEYHCSVMGGSWETRGGPEWKRLDGTAWPRTPLPSTGLRPARFLTP